MWLIKCGRHSHSFICGIGSFVIEYLFLSIYDLCVIIEPTLLNVANVCIIFFYGANRYDDGKSIHYIERMETSGVCDRLSYHPTTLRKHFHKGMKHDNSK